METLFKKDPCQTSKFCQMGKARPLVASHADVLRGSSRVPAVAGTRDEPLRTSAWEARPLGQTSNIIRRIKFRAAKTESFGQQDFFITGAFFFYSQFWNENGQNVKCARFSVPHSYSGMDRMPFHPFCSQGQNEQNVANENPRWRTAR